MSTTTAGGEESHPFENPMYRYAVGISGAAILAFIAIFYFEGLIRYVLLVFAALDAVLVPKFLEWSIEAENEG